MRSRLGVILHSLTPLVGVLPLWGEAAEVVLSGARMASSTTANLDGLGQLDFGMEGFEISRVFDSIWSLFFFCLGTGESSDVTPH